jgi:radical SAM superfamily enzyme YgiQ (UPF0313 family)
MDSILKIRMSPSLALLTIYNLTPKSHHVIIVNETIEPIDYSIDVDLVAVTVTVDVFNEACEIAKVFRGRGIPVVCGGIHVSADPESALSYFDSVCVGKAEGIWLRLLEDVENGILGQLYIDDMTSSVLASPCYDFEGKEKYIYSNVVTTSRGCPFKCDFCYNSGTGASKYINRKIEDVLEDIRHIDTKHILFIDDNFIGNPRWTRHFLSELLNYNVKWSAAVSANIIEHPDLLDLMALSGAQSLFIGFETLNETSLNGVHKVQNDSGRYGEIVEALHSRGIMVNASIVFGLDEDGPDVFKKTLAWMVEKKVETVTAHLLTPYPGTILHKRMTEEDRITDFNLSHYNTSHVVFAPKLMSANELYQGYLWFYKELYSFKNIIKRIPKNPKQRRAYLLFNFFYRKFGWFTELISHVVPLSTIGKISSKISYRL